ncbi:MAG: c-type cytochrome domain-containing protein [Flavisolibacter sp.]
MVTKIFQVFTNAVLNLIALKKVALSLLIMGIAITVLISCKHEIPGDPINGGDPGNSGGGNTPPATGTCNPDSVYFQQQVLPIFISNCSLSGCHDAASHQDGVVLTSYNSIITTGDVRAGNPNNSEVYKKITDHDNDDRMPPPPRNRLTQDQVDMIRKWIVQGAKNNSCENSGCDISNITYSGAIRTIISGKCQGCHSSTAAAGGYDYTTYSGVKARVDDGKLWGAVNHISGYSPMPKNGNMLSDCELKQIKKWIDAGAPNN